MKHYFFLLSALAIILTANQSLAADCSSEILDALRTEYKVTTDSEVRERAFSQFCSSSSRTFTGDLFGQGRGVALELDVDSRQFDASCATGDSSYFESKFTEISKSFIPEAAIKSCFGGVAFDVATSPNRTLVTITASSRANDAGDLATLEGFSVSPADAVSEDCVLAAPEGQTTLIPGGVKVVCQLVKSDVDVAFTLKTDHGDRTKVLSPPTEYGRVKIDWAYVINGGNDHAYRCHDQFKKLHGPWLDCGAQGTCNKPETTLMECQESHGNYYLTEGGQPFGDPVHL